MRLPVSERRQLAIDAALRVIATEGVESATTRRIADEAGVAQSGLFYAFESRAELLAAVAEYGINEELTVLNARVQALEAQSATAMLSPDDILRAGISAFADDLINNVTREFALISLAMYSRRTPGLESLAEYLYTRYYELVARLLNEAARIAVFTWSVPTETLAPAVIAMSDGMTLGYLMTGDAEAMSITIDAAVRLLLTYVTD